METSTELDLQSLSVSINTYRDLCYKISVSELEHTKEDYVFDRDDPDCDEPHTGATRVTSVEEVKVKCRDLAARLNLASSLPLDFEEFYALAGSLYEEGQQPGLIWIWSVDEILRQLEDNLARIEDTITDYLGARKLGKGLKTGSGDDGSHVCPTYSFLLYC